MSSGNHWPTANNENPRPECGKPRMQRASRSHPCPVCGGRQWCGYTADGRLAVCMRTEAGSVRRARNGGFVHVLQPGQPFHPQSQRECLIADRQPSRHDLPILAKQYASAVSPNRLAKLAEKLSLSVESLRRLPIGWACDVRAWSFPMVDAAGKVLGFRLRRDSGRKFAVTGGREGLFVPADLDCRGVLLICEGPTDTAAMLDLGFAVIGRPSCTGGTSLIVELVKARRPAGVAIVADADVPGQRGADALADTLALYAASVKIITPPAGVKDARAWKQSGATAADVQSAIDSAEPRKLHVVAVSARRAG